jgi:hypothetical protein
LEDNSVGGDVIFAGSDPVKKADSFAGVDGDLRSRSLQRMESFKC